MCLSINAWKYIAISLKREGKFYHQQHFKQNLGRYFSEVTWTGKWRDVAHPSSGAEAKRQLVQKKKQYLTEQAVFMLYFSFIGNTCLMQVIWLLEQSVFNHSLYTC